jgi:hypothetical protein
MVFPFFFYTSLFFSSFPLFSTLKSTLVSITLVVVSFFDIHYADLLSHPTPSVFPTPIFSIHSRLEFDLDPFLVSIHEFLVRLFLTIVPYRFFLRSLSPLVPHRRSIVWSSQILSSLPFSPNSLFALCLHHTRF